MPRKKDGNWVCVLKTIDTKRAIVGIEQLFTRLLTHAGYKRLRGHDYITVEEWSIIDINTFHRFENVGLHDFVNEDESLPVDDEHLVDVHPTFS